MAMSHLVICRFSVRPFAGDCPGTNLFSIKRCRLRRLHFLMQGDLTGCGRGFVVRRVPLIRPNASRTETKRQRRVAGELAGQLASKLAY